MSLRGSRAIVSLVGLVPSYNFNNSVERNCKFLLVHRNRIISLFLKVLRNLIHEAY